MAALIAAREMVTRLTDNLTKPLDFCEVLLCEKAGRGFAGGRELDGNRRHHGDCTNTARQAAREAATSRPTRRQERACP